MVAKLRFLTPASINTFAQGRMEEKISQLNSS